MLRILNTFVVSIACFGGTVALPEPGASWWFGISACVLCVVAWRQHPDIGKDDPGSRD